MKCKQKLSSYIACVQGFQFFAVIKRRSDNDNTIKMLQRVLIPAGILRHLMISIESKLNRKERFEDFLSVVAIVKNEAPYLKEWIEYHKLLGVTRFYIYDNESSDSIKKVLREYIINKEVVYKRYPGKAMQCLAYNDAMNKYKNRTKYMAFIDIDEFIAIRNSNETVKEIIESVFEKDKRVAGLAMHWKIFGSSNLCKKPEGLVISNYLRRAKEKFEINGHIKTICNPRYCSGIGNPHYPKYVIGHYCVDDSNNRVDGAFSDEFSFEKIWVNHYFTKSREEWREKVKRGKADCRQMREWKEFELHDRNEVYDDTMLVYANKLKQIFEAKGDDRGKNGL